MMGNDSVHPRCAICFELLLGGCGRGSFIRVFLLEALDAPRCIQQFLLAGEERMAARADFYANRLALDCGPRLKLAAAGTTHRYGMVIGMNSFSHGKAPVCRPVCANARQCYAIASLG